MADNVTKMKIVAWSDPKSKNEEGSMTVQVNPESYSQKIEIKYSDKQAQGTSGKLPKFSKIEPQKMDWLLQELAKTECPMSCPHGRPVVLRYSLKDIQRAFKRI